MPVAEIIRAILATFQRENLSPPLRTRLTKILYLLEVEYWRSTGERLTGLDWIFYHYGPYAHALREHLGGEEEGNATGAPVFSPPPGNGTGSALAALELRGLLEKLVHEWGDADLNRLLVFVYFETEPMEGVRRGERLDFGKIQPRPTLRGPIRLDRVQLNRLQDQLAQAAPRYRELRQKRPSPDFLLENLRIWDEDGDARLVAAPCTLTIHGSLGG